jgi:hypothetical protein
MKHAFLKITFLCVAMTAGVSGVAAQITINLPNIKKITKPNINNDVTTNVKDNTTNTTSGNGSTNWWIDYQIGEINKYKKELTDWNPANQYFPNPSSSDNYIALALSRKERSKWLADKKVSPDARLDAALDSLKEVLTRRLPEYTINPRSFTNRNAAEEKLMLGALWGVPGIKVYKSGFNQASWLIDKNELGIPKARYKHGLVYGRDPASEDPFCRVWYVNVVQDYAGGGTYGATEARYIKKEYIACPAGQ